MTTRLYDNATMETMYELIRKTYEGNNWVYGVKVEFLEQGKDSSNGRVKLIFRGGGGFREDQRERRGIVEIVTGEDKPLEGDHQ